MADQNAFTSGLAFVALAILLVLTACSKGSPDAEDRPAVPPRFSIVARDIAAVSTDVVTGRVLSSPTQKTAVIHLEFSPEAARAFRAFTRDHLNTQIQIAVGSTIVAEPVIRSEIAAGRLEVHFTSPDEARAFAASLVQQ